METYLFYDLETTGLNKCFDQVVQFAAIRTDTTFKELERHSMLVRLRPDTIYAPDAIVTNRISIADLEREGLCEYEAMLEIHRLLNHPDTISVGYNSLGFDDEFLRFSFHRNLLSPYTHQFKNGCGRMDILPITVLYFLFKNEVLQWPERDGKTSLKLEYLNGANSFVEGRAHDALVDVEATVELSKRLAREKDVWSYITRYFEKKTDTQRIRNLPECFSYNGKSHQWGLMLGVIYGAERHFQAPVLYLGDSLPYPNQSLWLRLDDADLQKASSETILETVRVIRKKYGEPDIILPPYERYFEYWGEERRTLVESNMQWLQENVDLLEQLTTYAREYRYPDIPDVDLDAALYQMGFPNRQDESLSARFHQAPLREKVKLSEQFLDPQRQEMARRILSRNYLSDLSGTLNEELNRDLHALISSQRINYKGQPYNSFQDVLPEIAKVREEKELDAEQMRLLKELEEYIVLQSRSYRPKSLSKERLNGAEKSVCQN